MSWSTDSQQPKPDPDLPAIGLLFRAPAAAGFARRGHIGLRIDSENPGEVIMVAAKRRPDFAGR